MKAYVIRNKQNSRKEICNNKEQQIKPNDGKKGGKRKLEHVNKILNIQI